MQSKILPKAASLPCAHIISELLTLQIVASPDSEQVEKEQKLERVDLPGEVVPCVLPLGVWADARCFSTEEGALGGGSL